MEATVAGPCSTGEKPLFYTVRGGELTFASELDAVLVGAGSSWSSTPPQSTSTSCCSSGGWTRRWWPPIAGRVANEPIKTFTVGYDTGYRHFPGCHVFR